MPSYVIVGASRGIGLGYLQHLAADPSNTVIGIARTPSSVPQIPNATILQGDLTSASSLHAAAAKAATLIPNGAVDHLIVNGVYASDSTAFINPSEFVGEPKESLLLSELQNSISTNVVGVVYAINAFLPLVRKSQIKKVVAISTGLADIKLLEDAEYTGAIPYTTSKLALNMVVAQYAIEFKKEGVLFLALSPGLVQTRDVDPSTLPQEVQEGMARMGAGFAKVYPEFKGPITVEESVPMQLKVIDGLTQEKSGQFLSHLGTQQWL
ncbi:unnamed protein product [Periconia digitata]|uniref:NAD(P)-binding protein n=1 Tax=Periconia digitata TaxID=1303443 RepID=A0A9W4UW51_9PLEO|nr:unnamed protein product [Periconia digitata]